MSCFGRAQDWWFFWAKGEVKKYLWNTCNLRRLEKKSILWPLHSNQHIPIKGSRWRTKITMPVICKHVRSLYAPPWPWMILRQGARIQRDSLRITSALKLSMCCKLTRSFSSFVCGRCDHNAYTATTSWEATKWGYWNLTRNLYLEMEPTCIGPYARSFFSTSTSC